MKLEFIEKSERIHNGKYTYELVVYSNNRTKVKINCPEHGLFEQTPDNHVNRKAGCPDCAGNRKLTQEEFLVRCREVHGESYGYENVVYKNMQSPIRVNCSEHGPFSTIAQKHVEGGGCARCAGVVAKTTEEFIELARKVHGESYGYDEAAYVNVRTPVRIFCHGHSGFIEQLPMVHLRGHGCARCAGVERLSTEEFIRRANLVHNDRYSYPSIDTMKATKDRIEIVCPEHGSFYQVATSHLTGRGCASCSGVKRHTTESFIELAQRVHGDLYGYEDVSYDHAHAKVLIHCKKPKHGPFRQTPDSHLHGHGCPRCSIGGRTAKAEDEMVQFLRTIYQGKIIQNDTSVLKPKHLDIYLPEANLAIEHAGLYYHCELFHDRQYHKEKYTRCKEMGIDLITVFEDEWINRPESIKHILKHRLGLNGKRKGARQLEVRRIVSTEVARNFIDQYHLQGSGVRSGIFYGAYHGDDLVAVMQFSSDRNNQYMVLNRFCTDGGSYPGLMSKMLQRFSTETDTDLIKSFLDLRWFNGRGYQQAGFQIEEQLDPDYFWVKGLKRYHKSVFTKQRIREKFGIQNETQSERELMNNLGYRRIWDCGKLRLVWTRKP